MKKLLISTMIIAGFAGGVIAQTSAPTISTPTAPDNANPRDNNIKLRSVELERIKRDENKAQIKPGVSVQSKLDQKFPLIKEDFEGIQINESAIIKTYTTDKTVDMALVSTSSDAIFRHASRLEENLFFTETEKPKNSDKKNKDKDKDKEKVTPAPEPELPAAMKDLILALDDSIGRLVTNKMFGNLRVVDPVDAAKAHDDVILIKRIAVRLSEMAKSGKQ